MREVYRDAPGLETIPRARVSGAWTSRLSGGLTSKQEIGLFQTVP